MDYFKFRQNLKNPADAFALTSWSTHAPIRKTKHFDYFGLTETIYSMKIDIHCKDLETDTQRHRDKHLLSRQKWLGYSSIGRPEGTRLIEIYFTMEGNLETAK